MNTSFKSWALSGVISAGVALGATAIPTPFEQARAASKIAVLVNNVPITTNDIKRRAAFFKLRRMKGNHYQLAKQELINEALQMQEARRIRAVVSEKEVDAAFGRFAQRNKMPVKALRNILNRSGVTVKGFKQFIKAQMSWQRAVSARFQSQSRPQKSKDPLAYLSGGNQKATEYTVQQIVFVVPRAKLKSGQARRLTEANNFRSQFRGCDSSMAMAAKYRDVSVISRGRVQSHDFPPRWAKELKTTNPGRTTRPLKTEKGVELLAVCNTRQVRSTKAVKPEDAFAGEQNLSKAAEALSKKYMAELKKVGKIKQR